MGRLDGKVAIVTGSSRGIGKAACIEMAKEGASIVIASRSDEERDPRLPGTIYKTADEVRAAGGRALPLKIDVSKDEQVEEMVAKTLDEFGRVDVLVNNAAVLVPGTLKDMRDRHWDLIMRVNLRAPFVCTRAVLDKMIEQGAGHIINISSLAATQVGIGGQAYGVTKAAIERLTQGWAMELKESNIACNVVHPNGAVDTPGIRFGGMIDESQLRDPHIMGRAIALVAALDANQCTGRIMLDDEVIREFGP